MTERFTYLIIIIATVLGGDLINAYTPTALTSTRKINGPFNYKEKEVTTMRQKTQHQIPTIPAYSLLSLNDDVIETVLVSSRPTTTIVDTNMKQQSVYGRHSADAIRRAWVDKSIRYYSTVMREERRKELGQIDLRTTTSTTKTYDETNSYQSKFEHMAYKHYFALRKIKDGKPHHAERIYRRIINELLVQEQNDDGQQHQCDHAKFAITTLLLALHMQRTGDSKATRSVFLNFFRIVVASNQNIQNHQCACSAKVLQAFALFEMKQGNELKSLEIVLQAIRYDPSLTSILNWKQFRDVQARRRSRLSK
jgi:hypothetical protein